MATFTAGTSFTDGVTGDVTAAKLNALVANATPLSNFITDRTAETSIATDDLVLISDTSDSGALNKMTVANLMKAEITGTINSTAGTITTLNSTTGTITTGVIPTLTSTTLITSGTGTAASPAIVPTGDTNTGIFFPAADTIAFSEGGVESMRIDSNGRVGIGTSSPQSIFNILKTSAGNTTIGLALKNNSLSTNTAVGIEFNPNQSDEGAERSAKIVAINTGNGASNPTALTFWTNEAGTNSTERLRIDSSGNVGIGTTSPQNILHISSSGPIIRIQDNDTVGNGTNSIATWFSFRDSAGSQTGYFGFPSDPNFYIWNQTNSAMVFGTNHIERLRITSGGEVCVGRTSSGAKLHIYNSGSTDARVTYFEKASGTTDGLYLVCYAGVTTHFQILGNGNCQNANNSYGAVSDEKIKQDIVDASTQWNDVKNLRVRKFRFKSDPSMPLQIGLVAQEVELVSPHLVEETKDTDRDGNDLGTTTKGVKYSVLYMKAVKALQEAMERIEQLETNNTALESRITALEAA